GPSLFRRSTESTPSQIRFPSHGAPKKRSPRHGFGEKAADPSRAFRRRVRTSRAGPAEAHPALVGPRPARPGRLARPVVAKNGPPGADERRGVLLPQADAEQDADRRPPRGRRGAARLDRVVRQGCDQTEPRARAEPAHSEALHQVSLQGRGGAHAQEKIPAAWNALLRGDLRSSGLTPTSP